MGYILHFTKNDLWVTLRKDHLYDDIVDASPCGFWQSTVDVYDYCSGRCLQHNLIFETKFGIDHIIETLEQLK